MQHTVVVLRDAKQGLENTALSGPKKSPFVGQKTETPRYAKTIQKNSPCSFKTPRFHRVVQCRRAQYRLAPVECKRYF